MRKYNYFDDDDDVIEEESFMMKVKDFLENKNVKNVDFLDKTDNFFLFIKSRFSGSNAEKRLALSIISFILVIVLVFSVVFGVTLNNKVEKQALFEKQAGIVCNKFVAEYGQCSFEYCGNKEDNFYRMSGLCYVRQIDFDADGNSELLLVYSNSGQYTVEVWGFVGDKFVNLYSASANNSKNVEDGNWITIYFSSGEYQIGYSKQGEPENLSLFSLSSTSFKEGKIFTYSVGSNTYKKNNKKDVSSKFETIRFSYIGSHLASSMVDAVESAINSFNSNKKITPDNSQSQNSTNPQNEAYYQVCQKYIEKYGTGSYKVSGEMIAITGLASVQLVDFDNDSKNELMLIYSRQENVRDTSKVDKVMITKTVYCMDVYTFNGKTAVKIFENEGLCSKLDDAKKQVFYMLNYKEGKTRICTISNYTDESKYQTGRYTSEIFQMKDGKFSSIYSSVVDKEYGYERYYVNNERIYDYYKFANSGYKVPYFYDYSTVLKDNNFALTYVKSTANKSASIKQLVANTPQTIAGLNEN